MQQQPSGERTEALIAPDAVVVKRTPLAVMFFSVLGVALIGCSKASRPNVLLVTVDTLRADRLHSYGYPLPISPTVDALSAGGIRFERCTAHASSTAPALASVLTGRYPSEVGVVTNAHALSESSDTLAQIFKRANYRTAAFVSNYNLRTRMGFARGFDRYDDKLPNQERNRSRVRERTADQTTEALLAWLKDSGSSDSPFFVWLHYQDPHGPYAPPEEFIPAPEQYSGETKTLPVLRADWGQHGIPHYQALGDHRNVSYYTARYDGEVAFFDSQFAVVLDFLEREGLKDNTLIVFTADHGESMGEHGFYFAHERNLLDGLIRVPLIIAGPGIEPGQREDHVCHADLLPTLVALTGLDSDGDDVSTRRGRDIFAQDMPRGLRPIYSETNFYATGERFQSVIVGQWKLVRVTRSQVPYQLFDLKADPGELRNLCDSRPEVLLKMTVILEAEVSKAQPQQTATPLDLSREELEALKALGYMGG